MSALAGLAPGSAVAESDFRLGEFHEFDGGGRRFLYLVPAGAIFEMDEAASALIDRLSKQPASLEVLMAELAALGMSAEDSRELIVELARARVIVSGSPVRELVDNPPADFPLQTLVMNLTNQCNLSCQYCYEFGEDKVATPEGKPKFMDLETAKASVDFLLSSSSGRRAVHITFFGGETLMNFPVLKSAMSYARERAAETGKQVDFSLTTNATLLRPEIIEFLAENRVGVTISIDGPKEMQDQFRVFSNGKGSYDIVAPKIKELLKRHRSRPIGARVTLTSQTLDIRKIYQHLTEEVGFWEVGFAPVTTSPNRKYAIAETGFDAMLEQFRSLAADFLEAALANRHHGFSNVKDTLEEIHKGVSKAYPCGAGLGLMGVSTDGDVALCHRFAGSDAHKVGGVRDGIDRGAQQAFLEKHHIAHKTDCHVCWARPLCSGGCYHEAHTRYGDTAHANLHYCEWIRGWTEVCLQVYGELSVRNPEFFAQFEDEHETSQVR